MEGWGHDVEVILQEVCVFLYMPDGETVSPTGARGPSPHSRAEVGGEEVGK